MKCTLTNEDTNMLTYNIPLSRQGRSVLGEIALEYNNKLKKRFVEKFIEKSGKRNEDALEAIQSLAPRYSKKSILRMLVDNTREELFAPFEKVEEVEEGDGAFVRGIEPQFVTVDENIEDGQEIHRHIIEGSDE